MIALKNVPQTCSEADIRRAISQYGSVLDVQRYADHHLVTMQIPQQADQVAAMGALSLPSGGYAEIFRIQDQQQQQMYAGPSSYNQQQQQPQQRVLINISNACYPITKDVLKTLFGGIGPTGDIEVDPPREAAGGYTVTGYVTMLSAPDASRAIDQLNNKEIYPSSCLMTLALGPTSASASQQPPSPPQPQMAYGTMAQHQTPPQQSLYGGASATGASSPSALAQQIQQQNAALAMQLAALNGGGNGNGGAALTPQQLMMMFPQQQHQMSNIVVGGSGGGLSQSALAAQTQQLLAALSQQQGGGSGGIMMNNDPGILPTPTHLPTGGRGGGGRGGGATPAGRGRGGGGGNQGFNAPGGYDPTRDPHNANLMMGMGMGGASSSSINQPLPAVLVVDVPTTVSLLTLFTLLEVYGNVVGIRRQRKDPTRCVAMFEFESDARAAVALLVDMPFYGSRITCRSFTQFADKRPFDPLTDPTDPATDDHDFKSAFHRARPNTQIVGKRFPPSACLFVTNIEEQITDDELKGYIEGKGFTITGFERKKPNAVIFSVGDIEKGISALCELHNQPLRRNRLRVLFSAFEPGSSSSAVMPGEDDAAPTVVAPPPVTAAQIDGVTAARSE